MEIIIEKNPDKYSEFTWSWSVIDESGEVGSGLSLSKNEAESDAESFINENISGV